MLDQKIELHPDVDNVPKHDLEQGGKSSARDGFYKIEVEGHLDADWSEWLVGLAITHDGVGNTLLTGNIPDQAALHGVLVKIRDLGLPIISLKRVENKKVNWMDVNTDSEDTDIHPTNVQYAGLGKRLKAFLYDYLFILVFIVILLGIGIGITKILGPLEQISPLYTAPLFLDAMSFLVLILPVILYFAWQESSSRQATWGKRKVGIRVVTASGGRLTRWNAFMRSLLKFLPWQTAHTSIYHIDGLPYAPVEPSSMVIAGFVLVYVLVGIYFASALISKKNRTPYDWVSGAYVIIQEQASVCKLGRKGEIDVVTTTSN